MGLSGIVAIPSAVLGRWSSFHACVYDLELPDGWAVKSGRGCSPAHNRNGLIDMAFSLGCEFIYFLDDDLTFHPNTLKKLLAHMANPAIEAVVALSFHRQPPFKALWFDAYTTPDASMMMTELPPPGPLLPLKACTFGGFLLRMSAIQKLQKPYVALGQGVPDQWDDDTYFCRKLNAAGVQIWGDPTVRFGHTTDVEVWPHYDEALGGWSVVFARSTVPFLMQPWGRNDDSLDAGPEREQSATVLTRNEG